MLSFSVVVLSRPCQVLLCIWHIWDCFSFPYGQPSMTMCGHARQVTGNRACAGVRSMLYGSMLGLLGAAVLGTLTARYFGLTSLQDLKASPDPNSSALQRWLQPYKERIQVRWPKYIL